MDRKRCLGDIAASPPYRDLPRDPARDGQDRATGARFVADAESRRGTGLPRAAAERLLPVAIRPVMLLERNYPGLARREHGRFQPPWRRCDTFNPQSACGMAGLCWPTLYDLTMVKSRQQERLRDCFRRFRRGQKLDVRDPSGECMCADVLWAPPVCSREYPRAFSCIQPCTEQGAWERWGHLLDRMEA